MRHFPDTFRQRWNMIYQFFHEGNPSTQINRMISKTRNLYLKVNLEFAMRRGEMLQQIATNNWAEYFIGIGRDQNEVPRAKLKFADLDPPNASAFWGDTQKLLPNITDKSIDNFLLVLPQNLASLTTVEEKSSIGSLMRIIPTKLVAGGTLNCSRICTQIVQHSRTCWESCWTRGYKWILKRTEKYTSQKAGRIQTS